MKKQILDLKNNLVKFSIETNFNVKLHFLDDVTYENPPAFKRNVYRKSLYTNVCMDEKSECVDRYKKRNYWLTK